MTATRPLFFSSFLCFGAAALAAQSSRVEPDDWRRGAVCYEIFVRSFYDSNGDGVGDLDGLIAKLDYVNDGKPATTRDLGAECIWLMPIAESPSYHGYDVADYYRVDREYGTNDDFKRLVAEAHKRGIRVIVDMVLNHASSEHPTFQAALRDTASPYRAWYRFRPTHPGEKNPWGGDNWHKSPLRDEYYYGFFWRGMPDLNYETPAVREEAKRIAKFWLQDMGVDGFRLDAIPYLVEESGSVMHTESTHAVLREYGAYVRAIAPQAFTIGEVWDSTGAVLPYYPDQLDAYFAFDQSDAILAAARGGMASKLLPPFLRLQQRYPGTRWAPFLRNHDQTRTMTFLDGDRSRAKLAATLLLTLPGFPFVYYGEEVGMTGDKPDERLRTPMHWNRAPSAGFTTGKPWEALQPDSSTANVQAQEADAGSLLNLYRRLIHLRRTNSALGGGALLPIVASTDSVAAYIRRDGGRMVLVVANLGNAPATGVRLTSREARLPPGRYSATNLLGGPRGARLRVGSDGSIREYVPLSSVAAKASYLFALVPAR